MTKARDTELHDINRIMAILRAMSPGSRQRVLDYVTARVSTVPAPRGEAPRYETSGLFEEVDASAAQ
jgi:hypothetical protein